MAVSGAGVAVRGRVLMGFSESRVTLVSRKQPACLLGCSVFAGPGGGRVDL